MRERNTKLSKTGVLLILIVAASAAARAAPLPKQIGPGLYAYISDNDGSANSTFLVGSDGILVVDTGIDAKEGNKLLEKIRSISSLPVKFVVNTHYHPDHQSGNSVVGPSATVISTDWTREHTLAFMRSRGASVVRHAERRLCSARRARLTFSKMSEARAVQMKGLGFSLWRSM